MLYLELEKYLEDGLQELGVELEPRMYWKDVHDAAHFDLLVKTGKTFEELAYIEKMCFALGLLTSTANEKMLADFPTFFRRMAQYGNLGLLYDVSADVDDTGSEENADQLVTENKVRQEMVKLYHPGDEINTMLLASIDGYMTCGIGGISTSWIPMKNGIEDVPPSWTPDQLQRAQEIHGKQYDPKELYTAVMDIIRMEKAIQEGVEL